MLRLTLSAGTKYEPIFVCGRSVYTGRCAGCSVYTGRCAGCSVYTGRCAGHAGVVRCIQEDMLPYVTHCLYSLALHDFSDISETEVGTDRKAIVTSQSEATCVELLTSSCRRYMYNSTDEYGRYHWLVVICCSSLPVYQVL